MDENLMRNVPLKVQKKSGFDKSFQNLLTTKVGTLTPLVCEEVIPNTTVNMKIALSAQLPPLATDTFMRCDLKTEAFFVPTRILMDGYEDWLTGNDKITNLNYVCTPTMRVRPQDCEAGSLLDYLGVMNNMDSATTELYSASTITISALPALAYHRIWDEWYRNSLVQNSIYNKKYTSSSFVGYSAAASKYIAPTNTNGNSFVPSVTEISAVNSPIFADGVSLYSLRQRNFGIDYFTTAQPKAQQGDPQSVSFSVNTDSTGRFTIAALRAANSMQQFKERNGIAGNRMIDFVKAQYGANLPDAIAQRPVLLGSSSFNVYSKGIYQQSNASSTGVTTNNPFDSVAAKYGSAYAEGTDFIINGFTAAEPGYIMVLVSLVPKVTYASGIRRDLLHYVRTQAQSDMANPILQNTGNQPIYSNEVNFVNAYTVNSTKVFGYTDRYAEFKTRQDELHGELRDGKSLASFALQRTFDGQGQEINSEFLEIPTSYLDQVAAVDGDISKYGVWIDSYIDLKESMPLARYAVPSLQDPAAEHGETVVVERGGKRIS